jgi:hypothetical protein
MMPKQASAQRQRPAQIEISSELFLGFHCLLAVIELSF